MPLENMPLPICRFMVKKTKIDRRNTLKRVTDKTKEFCFTSYATIHLIVF